MRLGSFVRSFSLGPFQELLATVHEDNRGIFLWANQFIYRGATEITPSETPVSISLPSIATGAGFMPFTLSPDQAFHPVLSPPQGVLSGTHKFIASKFALKPYRKRCYKEETFEKEPGVATQGELQEHKVPISLYTYLAFLIPAERLDREHSNDQGAAPILSKIAEPETAEERQEHHLAVDDKLTTAPQPLLPHLVTMSMLPKAQWQTLVHLDAIRVSQTPIKLTPPERSMPSP